MVEYLIKLSELKVLFYYLSNVNFMINKTYQVVTTFLALEYFYFLSILESPLFGEQRFVN